MRIERGSYQLYTLEQPYPGFKQGHRISETDDWEKIKADRNRWVYDDKGRVIKLADANFVKNFDKDVREKIYRILYKEFKEKNPYAKQ